MLIQFTKYELKRFFRDKVFVYSLVSPILMGFSARLIAGDASVDSNIGYLMVGIIVVINPVMIGSILGFALVDDKEDNIIDAVKITPMTLKTYIWVRVVLYTVLTFILSLAVILISGTLSNALDIIIISITAAMIAPTVGMGTCAIAKNKIEAFAVVKFGTILFITSTVAVYVNGILELPMLLLPGYGIGEFAISRASDHSSSLNFFFDDPYLYLVFSVVVMIAWLIIFYRFFKKLLNK